MGLLALVMVPLQRHKPRSFNDHHQLLQYIEAGRFLPASLLWHGLGRPSRRHLLRLAGYRQSCMTFDHAILQFGRHLLSSNYVPTEVDGFHWQPHWLMHAAPAKPLVLLH